MPKENRKLFSVPYANNFEGDDSTSSELEVKEKFNKIFISATDSKSKAKALSSKRKQHEVRNSDASTESEIDYKGNLIKSPKSMELLKKTKIKKRKKEEVSSDGDSSGKDTVYSALIKNLHRNVADKPRKKLKRKEKDKILNSQKSHENEASYSKSAHKLKNIIHKQVEKACESDEGSSDDNQHTSSHNNEHVSFLDIKKELLSDNERIPTSEDNEDNNNAPANRPVNISVIKSEQQSQYSSSDSEIEDADSDTQSLRKQPSTDNNSTVTVLQDIRFTPKSQTVLERLKEHFGELTPIEITANLEISDSDEVSILRIPRNVDVKLKNVEIDPDKKCKINLGEKYVMTPTSYTPNPNYVVSTNCRVINFKNNIKMEKYIKSKSEPNILVPEKKAVPLPENLKKRHPLFGSDFQQKIQLSESAEKKLDDAIANLLKREKRTKKKKTKTHKDKNKEEEEIDYQEIFNLFNSQSDRIKKEASDDSAFGSSSSMDRLKGKKKQKIKQELELVVDFEVDKAPKKKKSKTSSNDQDWPDVSRIKREFQDVDTDDHNESNVPSKADKKRLSIINSTLMADILRTPKFNPEVSTITSDASTSGKKSKKLKKEKKSQDDMAVHKEHLISELLKDISMEIKAPYAIKKET